MKYLSNFAEYICSKWLIANNPPRKKSRKDSTRGILHLPNIFWYFFTTFFKIKFFYKVKTVNVLQCVNGRHRCVRKIVEKSTNFCHVCPHGTSRILNVLSWNLIF